jgi:hypothetical protein
MTHNNDQQNAHQLRAEFLLELLVSLKRFVGVTLAEQFCRTRVHG